MRLTVKSYGVFFGFTGLNSSQLLHWAVWRMVAMELAHLDFHQRSIYTWLAPLQEDDGDDEDEEALCFLFVPLLQGDVVGTTRCLKLS